MSKKEGVWFYISVSILLLSIAALFFLRLDKFLIAKTVKTKYTIGDIEKEVLSNLALNPGLGKQTINIPNLIRLWFERARLEEIEEALDREILESISQMIESYGLEEKEASNWDGVDQDYKDFYSQDFGE